ncbi:MAG TPA: DedA family protein [Pilimelia sp.]|nr:DedA family protein [Pilimelia sp.]
MPPPTPPAEQPGSEGGLTGWVAGVIDRLGEAGVALLVALETVVPPIPSELVLAMAGYLAAMGRLNVVLVVLAATAGALAGALFFHWLGARLGRERLRRWLDRIPLVDPADLDRADRWFDRYGGRAVLFGRMIPVVRSLVSLPAGACRMPLRRFTVLTAAGSGAWNCLLVGGGYALGTRWQTVERYAHWFDLALLALFGGLAAAWVVRKLRGRRAAGRPTEPDTRRAPH